MAIFDFTGIAEIRIEAKTDIKWIDIRPFSKDIKHRLVDNNIYFEISGPVQLRVELNNESTRPLYIFAGRPLIDPPNPDDTKVYLYGKGKIYDIGQLELKSGDRVFIEGGAFVNGSFLATEAENIDIRGRGILNGASTERNKGVRMIMLEKCENVWIEGITLYNSSTWTIEPIQSTDIDIRNVQIVNWRNGSDGIDIVSSQNVKIDQCFIRANDDCIALKSWGGKDKYPEQPQNGPDVRDVVVTNSIFWNMAWGNAIEIGFELRSSFIENVIFKNCDILHVERGAAISIHNGDYATVRNITYEDIRIEDARHKLIDLAIFLSQYSVDRPSSSDETTSYMQGVWDGVLSIQPGEEAEFSKKRGYIKDITFKNIEVNGGSFPFSVISGFDKTHMVKNVKIENLKILGKVYNDLKEARFYIENAENIWIK